LVPVGILLRALVVMIENVYNAWRNLGYHISRGRTRISA